VGKSSVARALAARLGGTFVDADDFHPPQNKQKMAQGIPLTDADRWGWLDAIHGHVCKLVAAGGPGARVFLACSALKQAYRERLGGGLHDVTFVYLRASFAVVQERLRARTNHFMPPTLLASQFATLEEPAAGARMGNIVIDAEAPLAEVVERVVRALSAGAATRAG
jgi:carbohydrate kinase (thermoresistant glucokinase family)